MYYINKCSKKMRKLYDSIIMVWLGVFCLSLKFLNVFLRWTNIRVDV